MTNPLTDVELRFAGLLMTFEHLFSPNPLSEQDWREKYYEAKIALLDEFKMVKAERDALVTMLADQFHASSILANYGAKPSEYVALQKRILSLAGEDNATPEAIALRRVFTELRSRE